LDARSMCQEGFWEVKPIRKAWVDHLDGRDDYSFKLWGVLMFQAWLHTNNSN